MDINNLPPDALRVTALNLPLSDIFKFCQTNKRFQQYICNYKPFWESLFLREVDEKTEIPQNAPINWYKEKIKKWPSAKNLVRLIREKKAIPKYIQPFNEKWNSFEIAENLQRLNCQNNRLTSLPPMPNLQFLDCQNNQLSFLPSMPNLQTLFCNNNRLTSLPSMPNLQVLSCENNQLTSLPPMPNLWELYCNNNQLTSLPPMPNLRYLDCGDNPLPGFTLEYWQMKWVSLP